MGNGISVVFPSGCTTLPCLSAVTKSTHGWETVSSPAGFFKRHFGKNVEE